MFGYVQINQPELRVKDLQAYRAMYCGVCRGLRRHGLASWLTLNYDMTFLALVLTSLYEDEAPQEPCRCLLHPLRRCQQTENQWSRYAADMTVLLSYDQCLDAWRDEKKLLPRAEAALLKPVRQRLAQVYPRQSQAIETYVEQLLELERRRETDIDAAAGLTGTMLAQLFVYKADEWSPLLERMGFYLGKFIYLMDATADAAQDAKSGSYNPLLLQSQRRTGRDADQDGVDDGLEEYCQTLLTSMMGECSRAFERLPLVLYSELLKNIVYSGVWTRYEQLQAKPGQRKQN